MARACSANGRGCPEKWPSPVSRTAVISSKRRNVRKAAAPTSYPARCLGKDRLNSAAALAAADLIPPLRFPRALASSPSRIGHTHQLHFRAERFHISVRKDEYTRIWRRDLGLMQRHHRASRRKIAPFIDQGHTVTISTAKRRAQSPPCQKRLDEIAAVSAKNPDITALCFEEGGLKSNMPASRSIASRLMQERPWVRRRNTCHSYDGTLNYEIAKPSSNLNARCFLQSKEERCGGGVDSLRGATRPRLHHPVHRRGAVKMLYSPKSRT